MISLRRMIAGEGWWVWGEVLDMMLARYRCSIMGKGCGIRMDY
jgi:hypothetical protein